MATEEKTPESWCPGSDKPHGYATRLDDLLPCSACDMRFSALEIAQLRGYIPQHRYEWKTQILGVPAIATELPESMRGKRALATEL